MGLDLAAFAAYDFQNRHQGTEFNFRPASTLWEERWDGKETNGASLYRPHSSSRLAICGGG